MYLERVESIKNSITAYLHSLIMTKRKLTAHSRATETTTVRLIAVWQVSVGTGLSEMCCQET